MNTNKLVAALVAALSVGSSFAAGTTYKVGDQINIAGSTALSAVSIPAIKAYADANQYILVASDSGTGTAGTVVGTNNLSTPSKIGLWIKVVSMNNTVTTNAINVHLLGSEGGTVVTASKTNTMPFVPLSITPGTKLNGDTAKASGQGFDFDPLLSGNNAGASITFSDVDQAVGRFTTAKTAPAKCVKLDLVTNIAAINFVIAAPSNFPSSNITSRQLQALLKNGHAPLSMFTGNPADSTNGVFITGRDIDSGTRVTTLVEAGLGSTDAIKQYVWNNTTTNFDLSIAGSVNGVGYNGGEGGYFSGGTLCGQLVLAANNNVTNSLYTGRSYLLGYTSSKDLIGNTNVIALSYNGVKPYATTAASGSKASAAQNGFVQDYNGIANGSYSFWSVGKLYKNSANVPKGTAKTSVDTVAGELAKTLGTKTSSDLGTYGYTILGDLNVTRASEGATIFKK